MPSSLARLTFIYDGDCGICGEWVNYWRRLTGSRVDYRPFQQAAADYPHIPAENFARAVHLIDREGRMATGAGATFALYHGRFPQSLLLTLYRRLPAFRRLSEVLYAFLSARRGLLAFITHLLWGRNFEPPRWTATSWLFLRLLGLIYLGAFVSFGTQIAGLIGADGILPIEYYQSALMEYAGRKAWVLAPMVFWFDAGDRMLAGVCIAGALLSILVVFNRLVTPALALLFALYLSLVVAGQVFMSFQWDMLLLEVGVLAIFLRGGAPLPVWLFRWLVFRFFLLGGLVKIVSGDPTWDNLTALNYHFETQPLPTVAAWYAHHLPESVLAALTAVTLFIELVMPLLVFAPRRPRMAAACCLIALQCAILLTGNYNFFNMLTLALCLFLFDDAALRRVLPRRLDQRLGALPAPTAGKFASLLTGMFAAVVLISSSEQLWSVASRQRGADLSPISEAIAPCRCVNTYGPFAVMTTVRHEIEIEGSADGEHWQAWGFAHKPGPLDRISGWIIPHQPRLDWQMWFAALDRPDRLPWFRNLLVRLLQGSAPVVALFETDPFAGTPPRWVRARFWRYQFTTTEERAAGGAWWKRTLVGDYVQPMRIAMEVQQ